MSLPPALPLVPGRLLADPSWLRARVDDSCRQWTTTDRGVAATLWWYSATVVLLGPSVHALVRTGAGAEYAAALTLTAAGNLERVVPGDALDPGPAAYGAHLAAALAPVVAALADAGSVPPQRLWALAADSLGNRLIAERATELAVPIAAAAPALRPAPRYLRIAPDPSRPEAVRTYLRRGSCCLLFRLPSQPFCVSCPRQDPAQRAERLERHARSVPGPG